MDKKGVRESKRKYAEAHGFRLNPDEKIVDTIMEGLIANFERHGALYCPCRRITGNKKKDRDIVCPCRFHMEELDRDGHCHCLLFVK